MTSLDTAPSYTLSPKKKCVMVVGSLSLAEMDLIKERLAEHNVSARTFNTDEGLDLSDVTQGIESVASIVIVLSADRSHWCNRHSARLSMEATGAGVKFCASKPCSAEEAAQKALAL